MVRLPRIHAERPIREETVEAPPTLPPLRVLVVEDNKDAREMLRTYLELDGHQVHEAANGPEAVEQALRLQPDVALLDLGLPGFDGLEVARRSARRAQDPRDPADRPSPVTARPPISSASELGFDSHLVKPVSPNQLTEASQGAEAQRGERRPRERALTCRGPEATAIVRRLAARLARRDDEVVSTRAVEEEGNAARRARAPEYGKVLLGHDTNSALERLATAGFRQRDQVPLGIR